MLLRRLVFLLLGTWGAVAASAAQAQSGSFTINAHSTAVGTATFDVRATPKGYESSSVVKVSMQGLTYSLSKTEQLNSANRLVHVLLSGIVNGSAVSIAAKPDAGQILINISANGRATTTRLDGHPNAVVLADFDAGALETLLVIAGQQNNRDLWAVLPKGSGSIQPVRLATYADQKGTYNGNPITVHHLVATIGSDKTDLFSGPENQLLQAELNDQGFALVRKGFVLTPPAKPGAPPEPPAGSQAPPAGAQAPPQQP
jgi:hypothetical protein